MIKIFIVLNDKRAEVFEKGKHCLDFDVPKTPNIWEDLLWNPIEDEFKALKDYYF